MTPEEFLDNMFPNVKFPEWQRKLLIEFLNKPVSERRILVSPRRGDAQSRVRLTLFMLNVMFEECNRRNKDD